MPSRLLTALLLIAVAACGAPRTARPGRVPATPSPPEAGLREPYAYTTPTPPAAPTSADGVYTRSLAKEQAGGAGPCRRCPPYRLEVAESTLTLDQGVFLIENEVDEAKAIDWRSIGHYTVEGDTITFFNDPNCPDTRGSYRWQLLGGTLTLEVVEDECAFGGLRWRYLTAAPWTG